MKIQIKSTLLGLSILGIFIMNSCKKEQTSLKETAVNITTTAPVEFENVKLLSGQIIFKEINTGKTTTADQLVNGTVNIQLSEGAYNVSLKGSMEYTFAGTVYTGEARAFKEKVIINGASAAISLPFFLFRGTEGFVFKEIFFTGTVTPEGKPYNGDKYFIIHNNTDHVLYADSLLIAESSFLTTTKKVYTPDVMATDFTAGSIVMIPGTGKTYPIEAGESFVVANNAINHKEFNANSIDLSKAKFELQLLGTINVDNPQVTDLINIAGFMTMHNRGFKSYVLGKMQGTVDSYKTNNYYTYSSTSGTGSVSNQQGYKIPNSWIQDAVNLSVETSYEWIVTSPQLDMGWSYCGKKDGDGDRYGKSVTRKVESTTTDGRLILQDTNNSSKDFIAESPLSFKK